MTFWNDIRDPCSCQRACPNAEFSEWVKTPILRLALSGAKFMKFADDVWDPSLFPSPFPDCQCKFIAGDIGPQSCH